MTISLEREKSLGLSTQDVYDLINLAVEAADDSGFVNTFVLERALYELAAVMYEEDPGRKSKMSSMVAENVNTAWDVMVKDGTIDALLEGHKEDVDYIADCAATWVSEYTEYAHSARGLLDAFQQVSGSIVDVAAKQLEKTAKDTGAAEVLEIADRWGMNRKAEDAQELVKEVVEDKAEKDANKAEKKAKKNRAALKVVDGDSSSKDKDSLFDN